MATEAFSRTTEIPQDDPRMKYGIFNFMEAAKYLGVPWRTMYNWGRGTRAGAKPVITAFAGDARGPTIPFIGFAESYALTALRHAGVSMQRIRPAVADLKKEIGLEHALASRNLSTDGVDVLYKYAGDDPDHTVVSSKQRQFRKAVEEYLKPIHYGPDDFADRLWLPIYGERTVFVDPRKAFGYPLLSSGKARVEDVADRFAAGESIEDLVSDFRITPEEVQTVVRVEALASRVVPA